MSYEFQRIHPTVQKWVYKQKWKDLRDIQKQSIDPILNGQKDVIISASTASGKTEAFFLPACSAIADINNGFGILYISPLKALINDQYRRLEELCEMLNMRVTPWHGDISQSKKRQAKKNPSGVVLITPESLESLLIRESGWVKKAFSSIKYIVIDEFHAFIGMERGYHLLSLLNRLDILLDFGNRPTPRIALSATLGNLEQIPSQLRPNPSLSCVIIEDKQKSQSTLKMKLFGYIESADKTPDNPKEPALYQICKKLYTICRGDSHLIFANSRQRTESISAQLSDFCEQNIVPNEFFPHHGSLAKELREELELRLQKETLPTTAICTMTLELGIDIGKVNSVAQITAPHSVSSLRQRLGRSGRRGSASILRMFIIENELTVNSNIIDKLRMELLQSIAMLRLLILDKWFEPADTEQFHFSTFLHQILAVLAQWGGVRANQLYSILCESRVFSKISIEHFKILLVDMGEKNLITQMSNGELTLGIEGERLVNQYTFYAVFKTPEEYRLINGSKTLGTLPIDSLILANQSIIFAGRRWKVKDIDPEKKTIYVEATKGGQPPNFGGEGMHIHNRIRQEMLEIYCNGDYRIYVNDKPIDFLDEIARDLFHEGLYSFKQLNLEKNWIVQQGKYVYLLPWMGDKIVNTLVMILVQADYKATAFAGVIEVEKVQINEVINYLKEFLKMKPPTNKDLAKNIEDKYTEKYDSWLPESLLTEGYGQKLFDVETTVDWLRKRF
jgi:ATP-dependent Lhr-like helicase